MGPFRRVGGGGGGQAVQALGAGGFEVVFVDLDVGPGVGFRLLEGGAGGGVQVEG